MTSFAVMSALDHPEIMRSDGTRLAERVRDILRNSEGDVSLDFSGVTSASASAACRFYDAIARDCGPEAPARLVFSNASPWVVDSFEIGYEQILGTHRSA